MRIQLKGGELDTMDKLKELGVIIDRKLDCSHHIDDICSIVRFTFRRLHCPSMYLPYHVRYKVANALMMSHISYCMEVYSYTIAGNVHRIKLVVRLLGLYLA